MKNDKNIKLLALMTVLASCAPQGVVKPAVPSLDYVRNLEGTYGIKTINEGDAAGSDKRGAGAGPMFSMAPPVVQYAKDESAPDAKIAGGEGATADYRVYHSKNPNIRDYSGSLAFGDPGVSASLWRENRGGNDLFRDIRAWQPMDLLTVVISESAEGAKSADTEVKQSSSVSAAISALLGLDTFFKDKNPTIDPKNLVSASTTNDSKGEGTTNRKDSLKARISAMVVETLPSGILRIEGEKIVAVNNEEQVMVVSGLVRPRDISSINEIDSSKIANMRIDYYGRGVIGEAQAGGWLARIMRRLWPF